MISNSIAFHAALSTSIALFAASVPLLFARRVLGLLPAEIRAQAGRELSRPRLRLLVGTAATATVCIGYLLLDEEAVRDGRRQGVLVLLHLAAFHAPFWILAFPYLRALDRVYPRSVIDPREGGPRRQASLRPRSPSDHLPHLFRVLPWLLGGGATAWLLFRVLSTPGVPIAMPAGFYTGGMTLLMLLPVWLREESILPALARRGGQGTDPAAEELRRFRVRGVALLQLSGACVFFVLAALALEIGRGFDGNIQGWVGAIAGSLVGVLGSAFGIRSAFLAFRLRTSPSAPPSARTLPGGTK